MFTWIKTLLLPSTPVGAPRLLRVFNHGTVPVGRDLVAVLGERPAWRLHCRKAESVPIFEIKDPQIDRCFLTYRAEIRSEGLRHPVCLELGCLLPGRSPLVRRGWHQLVSGDHDWEYFEISQYLAPGQVPELVQLNLATKSSGTIWIKNVTVLVTPAG